MRPRVALKDHKHTIELVTKLLVKDSIPTVQEQKKAKFMIYDVIERNFLTKNTEI